MAREQVQVFGRLSIDGKLRPVPFLEQIDAVAARDARQLEVVNRVTVHDGGGEQVAPL